MHALKVIGEWPSRLRRVVPGLVLLFALAHFAHHLVTALPVPLLPFIRNEFNLDYTKAALVVSAFSVPYGFSQLPAGWLADRFGARRLVLIGISGVALAGVMVGLSTSYTMLLVALFLMGALGGGYHPSAPVAISQVTDPSRRGSALGVHMIGGSASFFLAPLAAAALAAVWGWRLPFIALAVPAMAFGLAFFAILGRRERAARGVSVSPELSQGAASAPDGEVEVDWRRMAAFLALTSVSSAVVLAALAFVPLYLVDVHGYAERDGAIAVALFYSTGLWAAVAGGYLSDRIGRVKVVVLFALLAGPALAVLDLSGSSVAVMALILFLGAGHYVRAPASESYIVGHTPKSKRSTVLGLYFFGSIEASGILAPLVGTLVDHYGFRTSFLLSGVGLLAVATVCAIILLQGHASD
jgi:MFS family permease